MANGIELGKAFVQIVPRAQGIKGSISNLMGGEADSAGTSAGSKIATALKGSLGKALAGIGIGAMIKKSLDIGGALEQSFIGGLDTLYGEAADAARNYAKEAAAAGISMNTYAEQAVSFGAALKQSFKGAEDAEARAAEAANMAILDMADNAAKMGTSMESIQNAYQGFAKGNYTMLDNLKLGYGGTRSEMERLLQEASKLEAAGGKTFDIDNLADVYEAIHLIQGDLHLTGVAAQEAGETLQGSMNAMKASAENFLGSLMLGENVAPALEGLVTSTSNFLINNLLPAIGRIFNQIPDLIGTGANMIASLAEGIASKIPTLIQQGLAALTTFSTRLRENFGVFVDAGLNLIQNIVKGIVSAIPNLVKQAPQIISNFAGLINDNGPKLLNAGKNILLMLWEGIKSMVTSIKDNWESVLEALVDVWEAINWLNLGKGLINAIVSGVILLWEEVPKLLKDIATAAWEWFTSIDWVQLGKDTINFIVDGVASLLGKIPEKLREIGDSASEKIKSIDWVQVGRDIVNFIKKGFIFLFNDLPNKLREIGESALEKILSIDWIQLGKDIINSIISGVKNIGSSLWQAIKGVATGAKDEATKVDFTGVGEDWMSGLKKGIENGKDGVTKAAGVTSKAVKETTEATWLIGSPSKVAMRLGEWWSEGLGLGITKGADYVYDAVGDIGGGMDSRMYNAVSPMALAANASPVATASLSNGQGVVITNNITVDGAEDPESWAARLVRQLQLDMRAI